MGWPQPKSPIQMDNSTAAGVTNKTIVPRRSKMMDMQFWWLRCHASQDQFVITGMQVSRTGPTTTPNTTLAPTTKPIEACMQVTGPRWVLKPVPCSLLPMSPRVFPHRFSLFLFPYISYIYVFKLNIISPTLWMLLQGCVDPHIPGYGQTTPKSSSCTCQHHLNVAQEPSRLS
jgi:hypothetical protein